MNRNNQVTQQFFLPLRLVSLNNEHFDSLAERDRGEVISLHQSLPITLYLEQLDSPRWRR